MPAVIEEIAFRGFIQSALERFVGAREAPFIQAALFSVLHLLPLMFIRHFLMGLCFGLMRPGTPWCCCKSYGIFDRGSSARCKMAQLNCFLRH